MRQLIPVFVFTSLLMACGGDSLSFGLIERGTTAGGQETFQSSALRWGGVELVVDPARSELQATTGIEDEIDPNVLELYEQDGARVALDCELVVITDPDVGDNPHKNWVCPLTSVAPGVYDLVHRERLGTGRSLNCIGECPWTEFDGESALVLELTISTP